MNSIVKKLNIIHSKSNSKEKMPQRTTSELVENTELQEKYTRNWLWRSLAALIEVDGFKPSPIWVADRLGVGVEDVVDAFEGLEKLGIIRRTDSGYEKVLKYVFFSSRDLDRKLILTDHILVSTQLQNRLNPYGTKTNSFYRTGFVATNKVLVQDFNRKIDSLMKGFLEESARDIQRDLYGFTFSNVNLLENLENKEEL